jgi:GntR family transcriptional regulator
MTAGPAPTIEDVREPVPPYLRIAGAIRDQIERGELLPGEQVPSMAKIAEAYGISRGTARRVLVQLREWGLIEITPGWGSFVRARD